LELGKSLTGLGLKKFKKPWAWACPKFFSTPEESYIVVCELFISDKESILDFICQILFLNKALLTL
jgi:hypothetical protein